MANYKRNIVHTAVPESIGDYYHNTIKSNWSLHVPAARDVINYASNSSFETIGTSFGTTAGGWVTPTLDGALLTSPAAFANRTPFEAYSGAHSLHVGAGEIRMIPSFDLDPSDVKGRTVTAKAWVKTTAGAIITIHLEDYMVVSESQSYVATGAWQEATVSATGGSSSLYLIVSSSANYYLDAVSYIAGTEDPGFYFDGDTINHGESRTSWNGTPHFSTSRLSRFHYSITKKVNFVDLGFDVFAHTGTGMAEPNVSSTQYALLDGSFYQRTMFVSRVITLIGTFAGDTPSEMSTARQKMINAMFPYYNIAEQNEIALGYNLVDDCGKDMSGTLYIPVVYSGGMDGNFTNLYLNRASIQFTASFPHWIHASFNSVTGYGYVDVAYKGTAPGSCTFSVSPTVAGTSVALSRIYNADTGVELDFTRLNAAGVTIPAYGNLYINTNGRYLQVMGYPVNTNHIGALTPSTIPDNFRLVSGDNRIVVVTSGAAKTVVNWQNKHYSIDAAAVIA